MRIEEVVGRNILKRREELGMSQQELGKRLEPYLGRRWSRQAVSAAEKGDRAFTAAELVALAVVLDHSVPFLTTPSQPGAGPIKLKGPRELTVPEVAVVFWSPVALDTAFLIQGLVDLRRDLIQAVSRVQGLLTETQAWQREHVQGEADAE